jgi:hypothetical protein
MRLFRRRRDAMDHWQSGLTRGSRWSAEPEFEHAPDLDPSEVEPPQRVGFDGRPLPKNKGPLSGLEGGGVQHGRYPP